MIKLSKKIGADEALIKEYQTMFGKLSDFKGSANSAIELLRKIKTLLNGGIITTNTLKQRDWGDNYKRLENESSRLISDTFKTGYLYQEFAKNIPEKVKLKEVQALDAQIESGKIPFKAFLNLLIGPEADLFNKISNERIFLLEQAIFCIKEYGLLESEINKRSRLTHLRYHIQFTLSSSGKRREKVRDLFISRKEVEDIFTALKTKGGAIIKGKTIHLEPNLEVLVTETLLQAHEANFYRKKYQHQIRNDDAFVKSFKDVTKEFYNNAFLEGFMGVKVLQNHAEPVKSPTVEYLKNNTMKTDLEKSAIQIKAIKEDIKKGRLIEALDKLDVLIEALDEKSLETDFVLASSQYHTENKSIMYNLKENEVPRNRAVAAILDIVTKVEQLIVSKKSATVTDPGVFVSNKALEKPYGESTGYCIRTGVPIPFNVDKPLSYESFLVWSQFEDDEYPEKYCHFSGEPSNGETCFRWPVLKKNWEKAKVMHGL